MTLPEILRQQLAALQTCATSDPRRPIYVFAHMANSLEEFEGFLAQGVNAIEADVSFAPNGTVTDFYHGPGCDSGRECERRTDAGVYFNHVKRTVSAENGRNRDKMLLLYVDIKPGNLAGKKEMYAGGVSLAQKLMLHLWNEVPPNRMVNVLLSVYSLKETEVFRGALRTLSTAENHADLLEHVGFDVSGINFLSSIATTFNKLGVRRHRWQGDGRPNRYIDVYPTLRMSWVTARRAQNSSVRSYVDKAYVWTADHTFTIRRFLRKKIDGIVTNSPENVFAILKSSEFLSQYRLANSLDNPWERIV
ncbi:hypothetical protein MRX96_017186 [Rhipicephalus microplus]